MKFRSTFKLITAFSTISKNRKSLWNRIVRVCMCVCVYLRKQQQQVRAVKICQYSNYTSPAACTQYALSVGSPYQPYQRLNIATVQHGKNAVFSAAANRLDAHYTRCLREQSGRATAAAATATTTATSRIDSAFTAWQAQRREAAGRRRG